MRKLYLLIFLLISVIAVTQIDTDTQRSSLRNQIIKQDTSVLDRLTQRKDSAEKEYLKEMEAKRLLALTEDIRKRQEKDKRNAIIRIAIGVFFLGLLVFGLMRRRKK